MHSTYAIQPMHGIGTVPIIPVTSTQMNLQESFFFGRNILQPEPSTWPERLSTWPEGPYK